MKTNCKDCGHFKDNHAYGETTNINDKIGYCLHTNCDCESYEPIPERSVEEIVADYTHCERRNIKGEWEDVCIIKPEKTPENLRQTLKAERQRCDEMVEEAYMKGKETPIETPIETKVYLRRKGNRYFAITKKGKETIDNVELSKEEYETLTQPNNPK